MKNIIPKYVTNIEEKVKSEIDFNGTVCLDQWKSINKKHVLNVLYLKGINYILLKCDLLNNNEYVTSELIETLIIKLIMSLI